ncbi:MAG: hypothetical protein ACT4QG_04230 [Sporichthyaceae bacterium]
MATAFAIGWSMTKFRPAPTLGWQAQPAHEWVSGRLATLGYVPFHLTVAPDDSDVSVVATAVPGLDIFSMVTAGVPIAPAGARRWREFEEWLSHPTHEP